ncbi:hypothetical protein K3N28_06050 [Glycomyces sp. TRM65418]|nr:hypothetical protein [Glycomyces sp. TRM65418]MCC3762632.1 hypothetical protein [Glycomyces sp. TRM65418]QZD56670.1 hypothetical protein K3N28_06010 [Glycomyces sp. TRM65418]
MPGGVNRVIATPPTGAGIQSFGDYEPTRRKQGHSRALEIHHAENARN